MNFRQGTELPTIQVCDSDPTIGLGIPGGTPNLLLLRTDIPSIYYYAGPLDTDWVKIGEGIATIKSPVVIWRPGSGGIGPIVFDTLTGAYAQLNALAALNVNGRKGYTVVFDSPGPSVDVPAGIYHSTVPVTWTSVLGGIQDLTVNLKDGVDVQGLTSVASLNIGTDAITVIPIKFLDANGPVFFSGANLLPGTGTKSTAQVELNGELFFRTDAGIGSDAIGAKGALFVPDGGSAVVILGPENSFGFALAVSGGATATFVWSIADSSAYAENIPQTDFAGTIIWQCECSFMMWNGNPNTVVSSSYGQGLLLADLATGQLYKFHGGTNWTAFP